MNKQQLYIFCLSIFGAYLLLNANYQARLAKTQSDDVASRLDDIELTVDKELKTDPFEKALNDFSTYSDSRRLNQKVTELEYRVDSIERDVVDVKSDVSLIRLSTTNY